MPWLQSVLGEIPFLLSEMTMAMWSLNMMTRLHFSIVLSKEEWELLANPKCNSTCKI